MKISQEFYICFNLKLLEISQAFNIFKNFQAYPNRFLVCEAKTNRVPCDATSLKERVKRRKFSTLFNNHLEPFGTCQECEVLILNVEYFA